MGIGFNYTFTGISLTWCKFTRSTRELLADSGLQDCKPLSTPLLVNLKIDADSGDFFYDPALRRCLIGKINFLTYTRTDLAYIVQTLSQLMQNPRVSYYDALIHTFKFVAGTIGQDILLQATDQLTLRAYSNLDWASCSDSRSSVIGYMLLLGQFPIS